MKQMNGPQGPLLEPKHLEEFSAGRGEPGWIGEMRLKSLEKLGGLPLVQGRYSKLNLDIGSMLVSETTFGVASGLEDGTISADLTSPGSIHRLSRWLPENEKAAAGFPEPAAAAGLIASAMWRDGVVFAPGRQDADGSVPVIVPKGGEGISIEPFLLDIEAGSSPSLAIRWEKIQAGSLRVSSLRARVGDGAKLSLVVVSEGGEGHHLISLDFDLGRDSEVELFSVWLGGRWTAVRGMAGLSHPGSRWKETHISWTGGADHLDVESCVSHASSGTKSDIQVRSALSGTSRRVFNGNIEMKREGVQSDAYLADRVLLLSKDARSDSVPGLIINAMDVRAAHAASTGQIDDEQLLYLQARGMDPEQAKRLLVKGFLSSLVERAPSQFVVNHIDPLFEERVNA